MASNMAAELKTHLNARDLHPTDAWLQTFLSTIRSNTPLPALKQTALFRLLATDITTTLSQPLDLLFPRDILTGSSQSRYLSGPVVVQVLDITDIGHSAWSQVESIEAAERGETTKGREVVRVVPEGEDSESQQPARAAANQSKGPFKLLLQDARGVKVYALDLNGVREIGTHMAMGTKLVVRNSDVRRGVVMLEPGNVQVLGGKIEGLDRAWREGRKERLISDVREGTA